MRVIGNRILVETESQAETLRPSGVITLENHDPRTVGRVIACPEGQDIQMGNVVIFGPHAGQSIELNGTTVVVLELDEVEAIYE